MITGFWFPFNLKLLSACYYQPVPGPLTVLSPAIPVLNLQCTECVSPSLSHGAFAPWLSVRPLFNAFYFPISLFSLFSFLLTAGTCSSVFNKCSSSSCSICVFIYIHPLNKYSAVCQAQLYMQEIQPGAKQWRKKKSCFLGAFILLQWDKSWTNQ